MPAKAAFDWGPYTYIRAEHTRTFENGRTFRFAVYGAYNAFGLIGSECNGIVVLDENNLRVLADEICRTGSGYHGPSRQQLDTFESMKEMPWTHFQALINNCGKNRYDI